MSVLSPGLRKQLESGVLAARRAAELGVRSAIESLGVFSDRKPDHVTGDLAGLRNGLRAKWRQLGLENELLITECSFEQWHRLLFARFLAENGLLLHPDLNIPVSLDECDELAGELGEPDGWSVAARFAAQILPGIFRLDDPCVRIRLAPEYRIALEEILAGLPVEVFTADDSLGWVYQYWQKDSKDEVNASERKVGGADLGPVTQLFTENYMVRFLLENSLGAWWAGRHPQSPLLKSWEYLRFNDDGTPAAGTFDGWPTSVAEVTVMDPCCGSGHFLVDAFGMLWRMRVEEEGLSPVDAQDAVLRDNLFGLELDPRCVQIAMFAVAFQAWKDGGGWRRLPIPNIACSGIPVKTPLSEWTALANGDEQLEHALAKLHHLFRDADTLGSLIDPRRAVEGGQQLSLDDMRLDQVLPTLEAALACERTDVSSGVLGADASTIARAAGLLSRLYVLVATNVPYLGRGRQSVELRRYVDQHLPAGAADLAASCTMRCANLIRPGGATALVLPETVFFLRSFERFRKLALESSSWVSYASLGPGAFETIGGEVVQPVLWTSANIEPCSSWSFLALDARSEQTANGKASFLRAANLTAEFQREHRSRPGMKIALGMKSGMTALSEAARSVEGLSTGDNPRYRVCFWEVARWRGTWVPLQAAPSAPGAFDGLEAIIRWEQGDGPLAADPGARIQGLDLWGRDGVLVGRMGAITATRYLKGAYDKSCVVLAPMTPNQLPSIYSLATNAEYEANVRAFDKKVGAATASMVQVPFDLDRWRAVAQERFPNGLPEPWSDDPTQWLFEGRPEVSTSPLQVAVGRLLGFRWPEQPEVEDLDRFADADGIVCLPSVASEAPAHEQLSNLLAAAYGASWNAGTLTKLLADAGSKKKTLADWLRDEFFKQHCSLFGNRPFVWHVWDGHPQGFSALVNYHRLDRKTLEKLTYTYLGTDWIERQRAAVHDDEPGAEARLAAAEGLKKRLELILEGEQPFDIYVRWKPLEEQPIGWNPDFDDGVRLNIRPFVEAGVLRSTFNIHWKKDRGTNPDGSERFNDVHLTLAEKQQARKMSR